MGYFKLSLLITILATLFIAGCSTQEFNPEGVILANTQVTSFLEEYPNSEVDISYYTQDESVQISEEFLTVCGSELEPRELYRFSLVDPSSQSSLVGFLDVQSRTVLCLDTDMSTVTVEDDSVAEVQDLNGSEISQESPEPAAAVEYSTRTLVNEGGFELSDEVYGQVSQIERLLENRDLEIEFRLDIVPTQEEDIGLTYFIGGEVPDEILSIWDDLRSNIEQQVLALESSQEVTLELEIVREITP